MTAVTNLCFSGSQELFSVHLPKVEFAGYPLLLKRERKDINGLQENETLKLPCYKKVKNQERMFFFSIYFFYLSNTPLTNYTYYTNQERMLI